MAFSDQQVRKLKSRLKPQHVRLRDVGGQTLHYLEGWHVVAEANRIFGFAGWDRETVSNSCVWTKQLGSRFCAAYVARVRITVRAGDERIIREGSGAGESNEPTPGQAHDRASKAAETDATKRALTTFGNCFGLTLYAGGTAQDHGGHVPLSASARGKGHGTQRQSRIDPTDDVRSSPPPVPAFDQRQSNGGDANGGDPERGRAARANGSEVGPIETAHHHLGEEVPGLATVEQQPDPGQDQSSSPEPATGDLAQPAKATIDKSTLTIAEPRRVRDPEHLKYVADQPCMICGRTPCEAHHLRYVQPRALGRKPSDAYTVPLCALHHRELHARGNERAWWSGKGRDPVSVADQLWRSRKALGQPKPDGVFG